MSKFNYVVSAHKPTVVTHTLTGNFTAADQLNLIIGKSTHLEIHLMTSDGLEPLLDLPVYGRIAVMQLFRPKGDNRDRLFICTERYNFAVLAYEQKTREIVTLANGELKHLVGRPTDAGPLGVIDPKARLIGMHIYDGILQVIQVNPKGDLAPEVADLRFEELRILQMCFLDGCQAPTLLVMYQDSKEKRHLRTYTVNTKDMALEQGPWAQPNIEATASHVLPVPAPFGGVLVFGEETVTYYNKGVTKIAKISPAQITAVSMIDANRYLAGDLSGNLYIAVLKHDDNRVVGVSVETLGVTSHPNTISYLDNGFVYIGSLHGDSQLIKLNQEKNERGSYVEVVESQPNLGAIVDMAVIDLDRQGQGQVVTCSGAFKDGSLRVIRNGIGINEEANTELPGIKGLWSLRSDYKSNTDKYLVQAFVGETRILAINEEEMEECQLPGFDSSAPTLYAGNLASNHLVQVTPTGVRLIAPDSLELVTQWQPPAGVRITVAHANPTQILLVTGGSKLVLLTVNGTAIKEEAVVALEREVSCLDITPVDGAESSGFAVVGLWDLSLRILALPTLKELTKEALGGEVIPVSVMFGKFDKTAYVFTGLGDGHLINFAFDPTSGKLGERKSLSLGTQPIALSTFRSNDIHGILAACDRPTVVYSKNGRLLYSNVNLKDVKVVAPFNTSLFPHCLAFATEETLIIGHMDSIQKLHIRTHPLGEQPRRIAYQKSSRTLAVVTVKYDVTDEANGGEKHFVHLLDEVTLETLHSVQLEPFENGSAIISTTFAMDSQEYYVVGTAYVKPEEAEPRAGRILVFKVQDRKLQVVAKTGTRGAVYRLVTLQGRLVAGINSKVQMYRWQFPGGAASSASSSSSSAMDTKEEADGKEEKKSTSKVAALGSSKDSHKLIPECFHHGHVVIIDLKTRGDFILVGDLQKSVQVLVYKPATNTLESVADDQDMKMMTAVEMLTDDIYLGAEDNYNLFTVARNLEATAEESRAVLQVTGRYHLGEQVNVVRQGSLVMDLPEAEENEYRVVPTHLFGTINGVVGVLAPLTKVQFQFFTRLEEALEGTIRGVGGFLHKDWRAFSNERRTEPRSGFVDGDLVEQLLELSLEKQKQVAETMAVPLNELLKRVEDVSRIH